VLTPLQHRVAAILIQLPEARDFVLAGGGAPVARGEVDRTTRDLDYFARTAEEVPLLLAALEHALRTDGLEVTTTRASGGFARLVISDGPASTEVDLAHDFRLLPPEQTPVGLTLAGEELAIDKVLALFDRADRDFIDLAAVVDRWGLDHLCQRAKEKDGGFDLGVLAQQLDRFGRLPGKDFQIPEAEHQRLHEIVRLWQLQLRQPPRHGEPGRGRGR